MSIFLKRWGPTLVWMIVIFYLSSIPNLEAVHDPLGNLITRKIAHITEYAILAFLINRSLEYKRPVIALIASVAYAVSDEYHQTLVPLRHGDIVDVFVDIVGIVLAHYLVIKRFTHRKESS